MSPKEEYRNLCKVGVGIPLFSQAEWFDVFSDDWDVLKFDHYFFPYILERKYGFKIIRNMPMTPYLSLISTTKPTDHSTPKLDELITRLPYADELYLDFHPSIETKELEGGDTFYEKHTNYLPLTNVPVFAFYKSSLQRQIKKAQKNLSISSLENIDTFHELYSISLRQRGVNEMTEIDVMTRIWNFAVKNGCGEITIATDSNGQNHAALFCVWDKHIMYYLAGGTDKTYYGSGAMGLLLHHAIIKAQNMGLAIFDFEGSMEKNIDRFFKTFGTTEKKYLSYQSRNSKFLQLLRKMKGR